MSCQVCSFDIKKKKESTYWPEREGLSSFLIGNFLILITFRDRRAIAQSPFLKATAVSWVHEKRCSDESPLDLSINTDCFQRVYQYPKWKHWPSQMEIQGRYISEKELGHGEIVAGVRRPVGMNASPKTWWKRALTAQGWRRWERLFTWMSEPLSTRETDLGVMMKFSSTVSSIYWIWLCPHISKQSLNFLKSEIQFYSNVSPMPI